MLVSSCSAVQISLPSQAISEASPGSTIKVEQEVRISFLSQLEPSTVFGNVYAFQGGQEVPVVVTLTDDSYTVLVKPLERWFPGIELEVRIVGGFSGAYFGSGRPIETVVVKYFVEESP